MHKMHLSKIFLAIIFMLWFASGSYAGSDRIMIAVSPTQMEKADLVFIQFFGPDGMVLESDALYKMAIHDHDCDAGRIFELVNDYKLGYAAKKFVVGIYLFPRTWSDSTLCFDIPGMGKVSQSFAASLSGSGRYLNLKLAP